MNDKRIGADAQKAIRDRMLRACEDAGITIEHIATVVQEAMQADIVKDIYTSSGWVASPPRPDHKIRLQAAEEAATLLGLKEQAVISPPANPEVTSLILALVNISLQEAGLSLLRETAAPLKVPSAAVAPLRETAAPFLKVPPAAAAPPLKVPSAGAGSLLTAQKTGATPLSKAAAPLSFSKAAAIPLSKIYLGEDTPSPPKAKVPQRSEGRGISNFPIFPRFDHIPPLTSMDMPSTDCIPPSAVCLAPHTFTSFASFVPFEEADEQ